MYFFQFSSSSGAIVDVFAGIMLTGHLDLILKASKARISIQLRSARGQEELALPRAYPKNLSALLEALDVYRFGKKCVGERAIVFD
jgi:hypothetical protein